MEKQSLKILKSITCFVLLITLLIADFIILGQGIAIAIYESLETQGNTTNIKNVEFDSYFLNEGEKVHYKECNLDEEGNLIININVKESGVLKEAKIKIENSNFELVTDKVQNSYIKSINSEVNEIELNEITYQNDVVIEIPIKFKKEESFTEDYFERENTISLEGMYVDEKEQQISGQIKTKMIWKQQVDVNLSNKIEKYIDLGEKGILLQQNVTTQVIDNKLPRENETLSLQAPNIDGRRPETVVVLLNGEKLSEAKVTYNQETGSLEIRNETKGTWGVASNEYKIIYKYSPDIVFTTKTITLQTKMQTKLYTQDEIEKQEEQTIEINQIGNVVSTNKRTTNSIYKGYMYANSSNETNFTEYNDIEISDVSSVENIEIGKEQEVFSNEQQTFDISGKVLYKATTINKADFIRIFGSEGEILIKDKYDNILGVINQNTEANENGQILISYDGEMDYIKIVTSKPNKEGIISIENTRAIKGETGYTKEQLKTFSKLLTKTKVLTNLSEEISQAEVILNDTKTEAKIEISHNNLSTLQNNENIQLLVTLKSNTAQNDLYKNPNIEVVFPKELEISVKNITQLNKQEELRIENARLYANENRERVIRMQLQGEQTTFENNINEGIQISITADINIDRATPSRADQIIMNYTNENRSGEIFATTAPINLNSKYGVLTVNKLSNYNANNDVVNGIDDNIISAELDMNSEEKNVTEGINIVNNYENEILDVSLIGKIPTVGEENINDTVLKSTFETNLLNSINVNGKDVRIYYSEDSNATIDSDSWRGNYEELKDVRAFKIEIGTIESGEKIDVNYQVSMPANLQENQETYIINTVNYSYLGNNNNSISIAKLGTEINDDTKENNKVKEQAENVEGKIEENDEISMKIMALTGEQYLKDGDTVKEGQGITYELTFTNNTKETLNNIKIRATNTNAIYYDTITYQEDINGEMMDLIKIDENLELQAKEFDIEKLLPDETMKVKYQISVKDTEEGEKLTGEIRIKSDEMEEKTFESIENSIEEAELKLTLRNIYSEDIDIYSKCGLPIQMNIQNMSDDKLEDVMIELPISDELYFTEDNFYIPENSKYEFVDYRDKVARIKINAIEVGETITMAMQLMAEDIDTNLSQVLTRQYFTATVNDDTYISNEIEKTIYQSETIVEGNQTSNIKGDTVNDGDHIKFNIHIANKGTVGKSVIIEDIIQTGLQINEIYILKNGQKEEKKSYNSVVTERLELESDEEVDLIIDVTLDASLVEGNTIKNYAVIMGNNVSVETNTLEYKIKSKEDNPNAPDNPDNPDDPDNPDNSDSSDNSDDGQNSKKGSISGQVWLDENGNDTKETNETKVENMMVVLINGETGEIAKNISGNDAVVSTDREGKYSFDNLSNGKYIVLFKYDASKYALAEYKKAGVSENINSDVITKRINLNNEELTVAATETLEMNSKDIENIDAGLIQGKTFDLKLNKYISTVIIQNNKGTTKKSYDKQNLVKIELDAKQLSSSNVIVEYQIDVTNEGEVAGYVNEIVDYIPGDLKFSSELNKDWYQTTDGYICTKALENNIINPGETKTIILTLTKKMTQNNTGNIINMAEINKESNNYALQDIDSTAGNKKDGEDDMSKAELIISIRTGEIILHIGIMFAAMIGIVIGVYLINKKVLNKDKF